VYNITDNIIAGAEIGGYAGVSQINCNPLTTSYNRARYYNNYIHSSKDGQYVKAFNDQKCIGIYGSIIYNVGFGSQSNYDAFNITVSNNLFVQNGVSLYPGKTGMDVLNNEGHIY
jgi:hypothetical protein